MTYYKQSKTIDNNLMCLLFLPLIPIHRIHPKHLKCNNCTTISKDNNNLIKGVYA